MSPYGAAAVDPFWLRDFVAAHGGTHPTSPTDWLPLVAIILISCTLIASTPPTPGWKLVRASIVPLLLSYQAYFCLFTLESNYLVQWGNMTGQLWYAVKALEVLLFYPPEEYSYRLVPSSNREERNGMAVKLEAEPVPLPRTMAKLYWTFNVWFSHRGIGWNCRTSYLINRVIYLSAIYLISDLTRSYMTFGPGAAFFSGRPGIAPSYDNLTITQRALYSVPVAIRVLWSIEEWHTPMSIFMVSVGGLLGWEGEWWSPWGWPPLFGSMRDLWFHPGLSHMWSKTWHQYFHHWLYLFGWVGIGETILRLPHSGKSARPTPIPPSVPTTADLASTPPPSDPSARSASPAHPIPTSPHTPSTRTSPKLLASNFLKSLIVFTLTGLYHDLPTYILLIHTTAPSSPVPLSASFSTTTFFILQPFALAVEAIIKRTWRGWKDRRHPEWARGGNEPGWLVTLERAVGFAWTWWWLGYTARYFVVGLTRAGLYLRKDGQPDTFSLAGGVFYGQWYH